MTDLPAALPRGSVLLHIGPYKTGSTALQSALFAAREGFAEHGAYYPGRHRRAAEESWSALGRSPRGRRPPRPIGFWKAFAADICEHGDLRTCVSSEDFGRIREEQARQVVADLGGERVHVVMVSRRLDRLLPSAWQERVKGHYARPYDTWLREILGNEPSPARRAFWRSHEISRVAAQWLPVVPPERFHVIVSDDSDRTLLNRVFEGLLGLPAHTLEPGPAANASLSVNAVELVRRVNGHFASAQWSDELYHATVYAGAVREMTAAGRSALDQPIPALPQWAAEPVLLRCRHQVDALVATGVDVIGDPGILVPSRLATSVADVPETISLDQATAALIGAVRGAMRREATLAARREATAPDLDAVPGRQLLAAAIRRLVRRGRRAA